jgi:hypothetical protein
LTPAGSQFLSDAREVLGAASRAFDRARMGAGELPLRLGYVSWLPPEAAAIPDPRVRIDEWASHLEYRKPEDGKKSLTCVATGPSDHQGQAFGWPTCRTCSRPVPQ